MIFYGVVGSFEFGTESVGSDEIFGFSSSFVGRELFGQKRRESHRPLVYQLESKNFVPSGDGG